MSELMKHTISQSTMIFKAMEPKSQNTKVEPSPRQLQNQQKKRVLFLICGHFISREYISGHLRTRKSLQII